MCIRDSSKAVKANVSPPKTSGVIESSRVSFKPAARKMIDSRRFGIRPHNVIPTAAIEEMRTIHNGMVDEGSSMSYEVRPAGRALAMKSVTNVSVARPSAIRPSATNAVGMSIVRGASSRGMVSLPSLAGFGTLL